MSKFVHPNKSEGASCSPLPNLFLVGAPKAGTTSIHYYLSQHPEVFMSPTKEPHFFSEDLRLPWVSEISESEYLQLFNGRTTESVVGESSTWYLYSQTAAKNIKAFNPDAKVLISLRSPVDLLYSLFLHRRYAGSETATTLADALAREHKYKDVGETNSDTSAQSLIRYGEVALYVHQVQRYLYNLPPKNVHILLFDDLLNSPVRTLKNIFQFLGVDHSFVPDFERRNVSRLNRSEVLARFLSSAFCRSIANCLPAEWREVIGRTIKGANTIRGKRPELDHETRCRIQGSYIGEIERLASLIGRDLSHWTGWVDDYVRR
jgi:hypothetical protein